LGCTIPYEEDIKWKQKLENIITSIKRTMKGEIRKGMKC
jgi:hypothetical protein